MIKKIILLFLVFSALPVFAAPTEQYSHTIIPITDRVDDLGSSTRAVWGEVYASGTVLSVDGTATTTISSATSTFSNGINLGTEGCFSILGTCLSDFFTSFPNVWSLPGLGSFGSTTALTTAEGNLTVSGNATTTGVQAADTFYASNANATSTFEGGVDIKKFLNIDNGASLAVSLSDTGNATVGGTFDVTGLSTLNGFISNASSTVSSQLSITDQITSSSSIAVDGQSLFALTGGNVGIGTANPYSRLQVNGGGTDIGQAFAVVDSASTTLMQVVDNGNVGIASTSPWGELSVEKVATGAPTFAVGDYGSSTPWFVVNENGYIGVGEIPTDILTINVNENIQNGIVVKNSNSGASASSRILFGNDNNYADFVLTSSTYNDAADYGTDPSSLIIANRSTTGSIQFRTGHYQSSATKMTILGGGNVGIGTASPAATLDIIGGFLTTASSTVGNTLHALNNLSASSTLTVGGLATFDSGFISSASSSATILSASDSLYASSSIAVDGQSLFALTGGNVGIGTASPGAKLEVNGTSQFDSTVTVNGNDTRMYFRDASHGYIYDDTNFHVESAAGEPLWINSNGNGNINIANGGGSVYFPGSGIWNSSGAVGIGTTTPLTALHVSGTITQTAVRDCTLGLTSNGNGSITGCVASDVKLKTGIQPLDLSALTVVNNLNPVLYQFKDALGKERAGFIAQEVEPFFPEAVVPAGDNLKGVDPNAINALNTKALQEMQKEIDALKEEIKTLHIYCPL